MEGFELGSICGRESSVGHDTGKNKDKLESVYISCFF